jgi:hypothetical protein
MYSANNNFVVTSDAEETALLKNSLRVRLDVSTALTMKNAVFCDIKTQFVLHRRHITSPL